MSEELKPEKLWCAACGQYGNHQSGTCPLINHPTLTYARLLELYNEGSFQSFQLRKENDQMRELLSEAFKVMEGQGTEWVEGYECYQLAKAWLTKYNAFLSGNAQRQGSGPCEEKE